MSVKEQVLQAIQRLPNDIDFRDVTDEIALLAAVQESERDIEDGRLISNDEMKSRIHPRSVKYKRARQKANSYQFDRPRPRTAEMA